MEAVKGGFPDMEPRLFDPDESVAKGAALFGWKLAVGDELTKKIALETGQKEEEVKLEEVSEEVMEEVSQDLADSFGLTLGAVKKSLVVIKNVTSKSFGIVAFQNDKEVLFNLILKNDEVPKEITQRFGTKEANQDSVAIKIMENELTDRILDPESCVEIGVAELALPTNLPYDSPIQVTFKLNEEGRLEITALEVTGNRKISVNIETTSIMTLEQIEEAKTKSKDLMIS
jgi:molecular chaperone DnaK (HSP70)